MFYLIPEVYMQLESIYKPLQEKVTEKTSIKDLVKLITPGLKEAYKLGVEWYKAERFFITGKEPKNLNVEFNLKLLLVELVSRYNECKGVRDVRIKSRVNIKIVNKNKVESGKFKERISGEFVNCVKGVINWAFNEVLNRGREEASRADNG